MDQAPDMLAVALAGALAAAGLLGWACYRLTVDRGRLLLRLAGIQADTTMPVSGFPAGVMLPDFALPALNGGTVTLSALADRPLLLVLVRTDCLYSRAFARELADLAAAPSSPLTVLIVSGDVGDAHALSPFSVLPGLVLLDPSGQLASLTHLTVTPAGYLVDEQRRTTSRLLTGLPALLAAARGEFPPASPAPPLAVSPLPRQVLPLPPLPIGASAPDFTLPTLAGDPWSPGERRGQPFILVFSDPDCLPCAPLLARLGQERDDGIVVISRGDAGLNQRAATRAGITVPVLLQRNREVARAYGLLDTPAAYAIDARGRIAAGPAIGEEAVVGLIAGRDANASPGNAHGRGRQER